jgi:hypothetical protein
MMGGRSRRAVVIFGLPKMLSIEESEVGGEDD